MDSASGSTVSLDASRNLIEVGYRGHVTTVEAKAMSEEVMVLLPKMSRGFTFLADLSNLESMDLDCAPYITKVMDACNASGIGTVVRIIPDPRKDIGFNILSIIHYGRGVHVLTFRDASEAQRAV
jgi:hypothetical protein